MDKKRFWGIAAIFLLVCFGLAAGWTSAGTGEAEETAEAGLESEEPSEPAREPLPVNSEEEEVLHSLYSALEQQNLSEAAETVHEAQDMLKNMLEQTLSGEKYLYYEADGGRERHMEKLDASAAGSGMVIARANTVFFGEFSGGKPEGECLALQTVVLESLRYTFAEGRWKDGKMNGEGRTGYRYCGTAPEGSFVMTEKAGVYVDNFLDGTFVYRAEAEDGTVLCWDMEAQMGVTVLTDAWTYDAYSGEYKLPSKEDPARAYVLSEEKASMVMWNNLIQWTEQV